MKVRKQKQIRWTFVPSQKTIQLYDALTKQVGMPLNKSSNIDMWVRDAIENALQGMNGGKPNPNKS